MLRDGGTFDDFMACDLGGDEGTKCCVFSASNYVVTAKSRKGEDTES